MINIKSFIFIFAALITIVHTAYPGGDGGMDGGMGGGGMDGGMGGGGNNGPMNNLDGAQGGGDMGGMPGGEGPMDA
jgi:hypothetical protein